MATVTLGTAANNTLTALAFSKSAAAADVATIAQAIKNDQVNGGPIYPDAFNLVRRVFVPNRGILTLLPGDYVAVDPATGWPIVLSAAAAAGASYVHT
jgi:hypothetical protein